MDLKYKNKLEVLNNFLCGIFIGISSGAALSIAIKEAQKEENENKNIVVILPDTGNRYLSIEEFIK